MSVEETIRGIVKDVCAKRDLQTLDVLYSIALIDATHSRYWADETQAKIWQKYILNCAKHTLYIKYEEEKTSKINILGKLPKKFLMRGDSETWNSHMQTLIGSLEECAEPLLSAEIESRLNQSTLIEKNVLSLLLNEVKEDDHILSRWGYAGVKTHYYIYDKALEKLTELFNEICGSALKTSGDLYFSVKRKKRSGWIQQFLARFPIVVQKEFWELGDLLVKIGVAYWIPYLTRGGRDYLGIAIPNFVYSILEKRTDLSEITLPERDEVKPGWIDLTDEPLIRPEVHKILDTNYLALTPKEFEEYVAELLALLGFEKIRVTPYSDDLGVDIVATKGKNKFAIQCKQWNNPVGRDIAQQLYAAMITDYSCDRGMLISSGEIAQAAIAWGKENNIECFTIEKLLEKLHRVK